MLKVRKEMTNEIVEYIATDKDAIEIEKYNISKDGINKKNKVINLNKTRLHERYWLSAGKLFNYLVLYKDFKEID